MKYLYDLQYSHSAKGHFELIHGNTATGSAKPLIQIKERHTIWAKANFCSIHNAQSQ